MEEPTWDEEDALSDYMDDFPEPEQYFRGQDEEEEQAFREFEKTSQASGNNNESGNGTFGAASEEDATAGNAPTTAHDGDAMDLSGDNNHSHAMEAAATPTAGASTTNTAEAVTPDGNVQDVEEEEEDDDPLQSVEEYLAARKQENQLFSFQRCVNFNCCCFGGTVCFVSYTVCLIFHLTTHTAIRKARNGGPR